MRCSTDIRKRVIAFVEGGGSKAEAARRFQVSRGSVYNWTSAADGLSYRKPGPKGSRRVDRKALRRDVEDHPDRTQKERARHFGVSRHCIWHNLRALGFSRKKKRRVTKSAALSKERRIFAFVSAMQGGARHLCISMKAALRLRPIGVMPMRQKDSAFMDWLQEKGGRVRL